MDAPKPIYGMNRGSVGFLMNEYSENDLPERLAAARSSIIHPLIMRATDVKGAHTTARAINEVSLLRQTSQSAKLRLSIDGAVQLERTHRGRHSGRDPRRLDRLQSLRRRPDRAARRAADGADADLRVPAPPLARRPAARPRACRISTFSKRTSALSRRPPTISKSAASSASRSRPTTRPRWCCCTTPAIRWTSASFASNLGIDLLSALPPLREKAAP